MGNAERFDIAIQPKRVRLQIQILDPSLDNEDDVHFPSTGISNNIRQSHLIDGSVGEKRLSGLHTSTSHKRRRTSQDDQATDGLLTRPWTLSIPASENILALGQAIEKRWRRLHGRAGNLAIVELRDHWNGTLDEEEAVGDIFDDRSLDSNILTSICKVVVTLQEAFPEDQHYLSNTTTLLASTASTRNSPLVPTQSIAFSTIRTNNGLTNRPHEQSQPVERPYKRIRINSPQNLCDDQAATATQVSEHGSNIVSQSKNGTAAQKSDSSIHAQSFGERDLEVALQSDALATTFAGSQNPAPAPSSIALKSPLVRRTKPHRGTSQKGERRVAISRSPNAEIQFIDEGEQFYANSYISTSPSKPRAKNRTQSKADVTATNTSQISQNLPKNGIIQVKAAPELGIGNTNLVGGIGGAVSLRLQDRSTGSDKRTPGISSNESAKKPTNALVQNNHAMVQGIPLSQKDPNQYDTQEPCAGEKTRIRHVSPIAKTPVSHEISDKPANEVLGTGKVGSDQPPKSAENTDQSDIERSSADFYSEESASNSDASLSDSHVAHAKTTLVPSKGRTAPSASVRPPAYKYPSLSSLRNDKPDRIFKPLGPGPKSASYEQTQAASSYSSDNNTEGSDSTDSREDGDEGDDDGGSFTVSDQTTHGASTSTGMDKTSPQKRTTSATSKGIAEMRGLLMGRHRRNTPS